MALLDTAFSRPLLQNRNPSAISKRSSKKHHPIHTTCKLSPFRFNLWLTLHIHTLWPIPYFGGVLPRIYLPMYATLTPQPIWPSVWFKNLHNTFVIFLLHHLSITSLINCITESKSMPCEIQDLPFHNSTGTMVTSPMGVSVIRFPSFFVILCSPNRLLEPLFIFQANGYMLSMLLTSIPSL